MNSRPVFVIRINGKAMNPSTIQHLKASMMADLPGLFTEYHVIFASGTNKHVKFECYHPNDIPEEMRSKTLDSINKIIKKQS